MIKDTVSGNIPEENAPSGVPTNKKLHDGQYSDHYILTESERKKEYIRPYRISYKHLKCNSITTVPIKVAETYARQPNFYGSTFCCKCRNYFPVGEDGEFVWCEDGEKVGI